MLSLIKWNQVTWYSRLLALVLFLGVVPMVAFYIGIQYQLTLQSTVSDSRVASTMPAIAQKSDQSLNTTQDDPQAFKYAISKMESGFSFEKPFKSCGDIDGQQPMNECFGHEEEFYSNKLTDVYTKVSQQVTPAELKSIQDSFSNLEITVCSDISGGQYAGGSIAGSVIANCESYFKLEEIKILQDQVLTDPVKG